MNTKYTIDRFLEVKHFWVIYANGPMNTKYTIDRFLEVKNDMFE